MTEGKSGFGADLIHVPLTWQGPAAFFDETLGQLFKRAFNYLQQMNDSRDARHTNSGSCVSLTSAFLSTKTPQPSEDDKDSECTEAPHETDEEELPNERFVSHFHPTVAAQD